MIIIPNTKLGKWSVGLNIFFLLVITISIILVLVFRILSFDDHWWDVTVPVAFLIDMIALYTGIRAVRKNKDRSVLVYLSIFVGVCTVLFILLHSLFINDWLNYGLVFLRLLQEPSALLKTKGVQLSFLFPASSVF